MSSYHWFSRLYCTKWLHSLKTRLHPLSNDCSASPDLTSSGLVGQYWCQMLSAMCLCIFTRRRHLRKNNKRALQCARWLTMLKRVDAILTHAYIPSPTGVKCVNPQRCDRDCIKETGISCQHSAARHRNGGKPEEAFLLWRHDNTANAPFSFLATSDFKMATPLI